MPGAAVVLVLALPLAAALVVPDTAALRNRRHSAATAWPRWPSSALPWDLACGTCHETRKGRAAQWRYTLPQQHIVCCRSDGRVRMNLCAHEPVGVPRLWSFKRVPLSPTRGTSIASWSESSQARSSPVLLGDKVSHGQDGGHSGGRQVGRGHGAVVPRQGCRSRRG